MSGINNEVVLVDFWGNSFGMRVKIALEEKGIKYQYIEEDITIPHRSDLVLKMNPVRKFVPILIHNGRPVCDSSVILDYIDETWNVGYPKLLPQDPYDKAQAKFWIQFVDTKVFSSQTKFLKSKGEDKEESKKELIVDMKQLEELLGDKMYFAGNEFGFLDLALIPFSTMFYAYECHGNFKFGVECPRISSWVEKCIQRKSVSKVLPSSLEMYEIHKKFYKMN